MKLLFDIYCDPFVQLRYILSLPHYYPLDESDEYADALAHEEPLPSPFPLSQKNVSQYATAQRPRAYQRFYQALTAHWMAVESLCLAKAADFQTASQRNRHLAKIWDIWTNNPERTLLEKLEVLEVTDFVWGFLGRKIFQAADFPAIWLEGGSEYLQSEYMDEDYSLHSNWLFFIRDVAQFLRPPHIIELLLLTVWKTKSTGIINGPDYLNELGLSQMGTVQRVDEMIQTETFFPLTALEEDIVNELTGSEFLLDSSREFCESRWDQYRCERWVFESRAKIFFREETTERMFELIMG
ncbi:hypothetical protein MYU51_020337 [Penicillium brevicompactum]|uniref:uncharacterized protein n=1 Tax=Penicillium brevicompactum TaxID=5074 RepID=UPI00253FB0CA|nr:uncharacterized protein N7506_005541 [Penicillium brevicompactum]KAJ5337519.1 hypothetical protein N7506_005541 [Penicillium brevicompactum]